MADPMLGKRVRINRLNLTGIVSRVDRTIEGQNPLCITLDNFVDHTDWEDDNDVTIISRFATFTTPELALIVDGLEILDPLSEGGDLARGALYAEARIELQARTDDAEPWL